MISASVWMAAKRFHGSILAASVIPHPVTAGISEDVYLILLLKGLILDVVEGISEFIPVSGPALYRNKGWKF